MASLSTAAAAATVTSAVNKARNQLMMRDIIMAETSEENRGPLLSISIKSQPDNVAFVDWVILVSILSQIGIVDLQHKDPYALAGQRFRCFEYESDEDGRITTLIIEGNDVYNDDEYFGSWDLPESIARLDKLFVLDVRHCGSLPSNFSNLLELRSLTLRDSPDLLENFPLQMNLPHLTFLSIREYYDRFQATSPFLTWLTGPEERLPSLRRLTFSSFRENNSALVLDSLRTADVCFQNTLEAFTMIGCKMNENELNTLMLEICPKFPQLSDISLGCNEIESVRAIVDRINNDKKTCFISNSIRRLYLGGNPVMEEIEKDPTEKKALMILLETFNTIYNIGSSIDEVKLDSDVEYALRTNHAGRNIVEGIVVGRSLPLSVWPTILERAYENSGEIYDDFNRHGTKKNATGLFYLLRNVPALAGRPGLSGNGKLAEDDDDDDSGGGGDEAKRKNSSKRKLDKDLVDTAAENPPKHSCLRG